MPSPFPGMDPYLEGYMWADVHQALAYQYRKQLTPLASGATAADPLHGRADPRSRYSS